MPRNLAVTVVQTSLVWEDPQSNRAHFDSLLAPLHAASAEQSNDLIVLPEMFTTGFTMNSADIAEEANGPTTHWMLEQARACNAVITGSLAFHTGGSEPHFMNRLLWVTPDGAVLHYDKHHLFRMAAEHRSYTAGSAQPVFTLHGWRIRPIICYDLRFPVWCRNRALEYDALLCVANWPDPRHHAWTGLLNARAMENQAYVIACNRIGQDRLGKNYAGSSMIIDPKGHVLADAHDQDCLIRSTLDHASLQRFREKFPVHKDADHFELIN